MLHKSVRSFGGSFDRWRLILLRRSPFSSRPRIPPSPTWRLEDLRLSQTPPNEISLEELHVLAKRANINLEIYKLRHGDLEPLRKQVENMMNCLSVVSDFVANSANAQELSEEELYDNLQTQPYRRHSTDLRSILDSQLEDKTGREVVNLVAQTKMREREGYMYFHVDKPHNAS